MIGMALMASVAAFGAFLPDTPEDAWITRLMQASRGDEPLKDTEARIIKDDAYIAENGLQAWRNRLEIAHKSRQVKVATAPTWRQVQESRMTPRALQQHRMAGQVSRADKWRFNRAAPPRSHHAAGHEPAPFGRDEDGYPNEPLQGSQHAPWTL